jgi:hypothetical protein
MKMAFIEPEQAKWLFELLTQMKEAAASGGALEDEMRNIDTCLNIFSPCRHSPARC